MSPYLMRLIDRNIGRPLCFLVGLWLFLFVPTRQTTGKRATKSIAFVALAEIGALVLTQPSVIFLREKFPDSDFYYITFRPGYEMLRLMGFAENRIVIIENQSLWSFLTSTCRAILRLRQEGIDTSVNFEVYARFSTLLCALIGADSRIGYHPFLEEGGTVGNINTHRVVYSPHHHITHSYMALAFAVGTLPSAEPMVKSHIDETLVRYFGLPTTGVRQRAVDQKLRATYPTLGDKDKLIILNANASDLVRTRRWPDASFVSLAQRLLALPDTVIVLTGNHAERSATLALAEKIGHERVICMAGLTTLPELIDLFHRCDLLVTNDSGPAHFASTTPIPSIILFGPETPKIFGPVGENQRSIHLALACSPCVSVYNQKRSPCSDNVCMRELKVADVFSLAKEMLSEAH